MYAIVGVASVARAVSNVITTVADAPAAVHSAAVGTTPPDPVSSTSFTIALAIPAPPAPPFRLRVL